MIRGEFEAGAGVYLPGLADTGCDASRERASSRDLFRVGMDKRETPLADVNIISGKLDTKLF